MSELRVINTFQDEIRVLFYKTCDIIRHSYCNYTIRIPADDITCNINVKSIDDLAFKLNRLKQELGYIYHYRRLPI